LQNAPMGVVKGDHDTAAKKRMDGKAASSCLYPRVCIG
jgi:hypothetical protein